MDLGGGVRIEMVVVPAGTFEMGTNTGCGDETPVQRVRISKPYLLGKYEVTQGQWKAVMGSNPSKFIGNDELPVELVSWEDCEDFIRRLNAKTGMTFRLPTEAEWEYACRAGTTGDYAGILDEMAWYSSNSGNTTHPVGQKRPNGWGLYDMHGNVHEWCQDWYGQYARDDQTDPAGATEGSIRVSRGGGWYHLAALCRSAIRAGGEPGSGASGLGLRLAGSTNKTAPKPSVKPATGAASPIGDTVVDLGDGVRIEMVVVPAGAFEMGSNTGSYDEKPVHRVTISKPYLLGKYEVTQGQWKAVMGSNPSEFSGNDELPVEQVSWEDCQEFIRRLNAKTGMTFRFPTEAEWEYACRAGTTGDFAGNLDSMGWYYENAGRSRLSDSSWSPENLTSNGNQTHPVGQKQPNGWGLYDMHGNVFEWCQDWYRYDDNYYARSPGTDPNGASGGSIRVRVVRGGSWNGGAAGCRSAFRNRLAPRYRFSSLGLRLARSS